MPETKCDTPFVYVYKAWLNMDEVVPIILRRWCMKEYLRYEQLVGEMAMLTEQRRVSSHWRFTAAALGLD